MLQTLFEMTNFVPKVTAYFGALCKKANKNLPPKCRNTSVFKQVRRWCQQDYTKTTEWTSTKLGLEDEAQNWAHELLAGIHESTKGALAEVCTLLSDMLAHVHISIFRSTFVSSSSEFYPDVKWIISRSRTAVKLTLWWNRISATVFTVNINNGLKKKKKVINVHVKIYSDIDFLWLSVHYPHPYLPGMTVFLHVLHLEE